MFIVNFQRTQVYTMTWARSLYDSDRASNSRIDEIVLAAIVCDELSSEHNGQ